jgi:hypothetical protein
MIGTVGERIGRVEGPATVRAHRPLYQCEISPAGGAEKRDVGITDRIIAEGTGGRKDKIQNTSEKTHSTSISQTPNFQIAYFSNCSDSPSPDLEKPEQKASLAERAEDAEFHQNL